MFNSCQGRTLMLKVSLIKCEMRKVCRGKRRMLLKMSLTGQCQEIFTSFFSQTPPLVPIDINENYFDFFYNVNRVIRSFLCLAGVKDTGETCIPGLVDTIIPLWCQ